MADFKPRSGSFLPLMEAQRKSSARQFSLDSNADSGPAKPSASPITLLEILDGETERALRLFELQTRANMEPRSYGASLKSLLDAGYIECDGKAPEQIVHLTDRGAAVARLARPA